MEISQVEILKGSPKIKQVEWTDLTLKIFFWLVVRFLITEVREMNPGLPEEKGRQSPKFFKFSPSLMDAASIYVETDLVKFAPIELEATKGTT